MTNRQGDDPSDRRKKAFSSTGLSRSLMETAQAMWHRMLCVGAPRSPRIKDPPQDSTGRWLGASDGESADGEITINVPSKARLGDCLRIVGAYEVVSPRTLAVMSALRLHENVAFREIVVVRSALNSRETWHWMGSRGHLDVVDWERSVVIKTPLTVGRGMVYRGVLDSRKLPPVDIFYGNTGFLYVSDVLRQRFEEVGLEGFSFEAVEVTV